MKTLWISVIATLAAILAWRLHVPQKMWPQHPQFADFLLALILCLVLQYAWPKKQSDEPIASKKV
jgi:hypothetical protein